MNKIKILYILNASTKYGGANKSFLNIILNLNRNIFEPVILLPKEGEIVSILEELNCKVYIVNFFQDTYPPTISLKHKLFYLVNLFRFRITNFIKSKKIKSIIIKEKIDLIHSNVGTIHFGHKISKKLRIPHVWHLREYQDLDFNFKIYPSKSQFIKKLYSNDQNIIITKNIFEYFKLSNSNSKVVYNGIKDLESFRYNKNKSNYFLFAGRLEENKGIKNLINSFIKYKSYYNSDTKLYIAGDTNNQEYKAILMSLVEKNNLKNDILFLGMRTDIDDLMFNAKALIVSSPNEGFGRISIEALFNGCLVIGYDNAGTAEIFRNKEYGFLYSDEDQLLELLLEFDKNKIDYNNKISLAKNELYKYSNENYIKNIENIYSKLV